MMPIYKDFLGKMIHDLDDLKAAKTMRQTDPLRQPLGPSAMHRVPMKNKLGLASSRASLMETKPTSSQTHRVKIPETKPPVQRPQTQITP
jgi:hypothetical protein